MKVFVSIVLLSGLALSTASAQSAPALPLSQSGVQQRTFFSVALQREMPYQVVLPKGYASSQQRYPVLYLLHGWQGDETNWISLTHLVEDVAAYKLIVVTPRAANSWYVNSATHPMERYADYLANDLIADVDAHYRTIASPQERAMAGLSMGGYGALLYSLHHPGAVAFVGSISGAFSGPSGIESVMPSLKPSTDEAFGPQGSETRRQNDLDSLLAGADSSTQPYMFLECGASDPLLPTNRHVVAELSSGNFLYEYHEFAGAHTWSFWDRSIPLMLEVLARQLHVEKMSATPSGDRSIQPNH